MVCFEILYLINDNTLRDQEAEIGKEILTPESGVLTPKII